MEDGSGSDDGMSSMDNPLLDMVHIPPIFPSENPRPLPGSILLDPRGYISGRTNTTTADGLTRDGKPIHVTFWVADPPRASFFTVYVPEARRSSIGAIPMILNTEEDIVLLRVPICAQGGHLRTTNNDYFVYLAGTKHKRPLLLRIPTPPTRFVSDLDVGLLRCRKRYLIALLCRSGDTRQFDLHLYNSKSWSSRLMCLDSLKANQFNYASKAITIGGERGSMGWVDLLRGILICDLLKDSDRLRYIPLPTLMQRPSRGPPLFVRDINVFRKDYIKFFDMCLYVGSDDSVKSWEAATWRWEVSWTEWKDGCRFEVFNDRTFLDLHGDERRGPTLKGVYSGFPALSLHDDDWKCIWPPKWVLVLMVNKIKELMYLLSYGQV